MKTKTLVAVMLGLAFASIFTFISCQKDSPNPAGSNPIAGNERIPPSSVPIDSIASYHRQALDYLAANYQLSGMSGKQVLETCVDATRDFLVNELNYKAEEIDQYKNVSRDKLIEIQSMFTTASFMTPASFAVHANDLTATIGLSKTLRDRLINFYERSINPAIDVQQMNDFVATDLNPKIYSGTDRQALTVFNSIWEDSRDYWSPPGATAKHKGCPYWEYANDAIGGLWGLAFGPVGSIIVGMGASAYTYWECN